MGKSDSDEPVTPFDLTTNDAALETGDRRLETGDWRPATTAV